MKPTPKEKLHREIVGGKPYEYYPVTKHIVIAPGIAGNRPTFKYTRIDVRHALGLLGAGRTVTEVAKGYDIPIEAVQEALELATRVLERQGEQLVRFA